MGFSFIARVSSSAWTWLGKTSIATLDYNYYHKPSHYLMDAWLSGNLAPEEGGSALDAA